MKESVNLWEVSWSYPDWGTEGTKSKEKWSESPRTVGHHQDMCITRIYIYRSEWEEREKEAERIFEKVVAKCSHIWSKALIYTLKKNLNRLHISLKISTSICIITKLSKAKNKERVLKHEKVTHHIHGIVNKTNRWFLIRNHRGQKTEDNIFKVLKGKKKKVNQEFCIWKNYPSGMKEKWI